MKNTIKPLLEKLKEIQQEVLNKITSIKKLKL